MACIICNVNWGHLTLCSGCRHQLHRLPRAPAFTCLSCGSHEGVRMGQLGRCRQCGGEGTLSVSARSARRRELDRDSDVRDVWEPPPQLPAPRRTAAKKKPAPEKKPKEEVPRKSVWDWLKKPAI